MSANLTAFVDFIRYEYHNKIWNCSKNFGGIGGD